MDSKEEQQRRQKEYLIIAQKKKQHSEPHIFSDAQLRNHIFKNLYQWEDSKPYIQVKWPKEDNKLLAELKAGQSPLATDLQNIRKELKRIYSKAAGKAHSKYMVDIESDPGIPSELKADKEEQFRQLEDFYKEAEVKDIDERLNDNYEALKEAVKNSGTKIKNILVISLPAIR